MDDLRVILDRLEPELGRLEGEPEVLSGGITNRNLRVTLGGDDYVLRLCGKDTEVLSIDRETEVAATRAANAAGVAPEVVRWLPDLHVLVTAFVPGRPMEAAELRDPATLAVVTGALRRIHDGPALPTAFPTFTLAREYGDVALARGGAVSPDDHALALELSERIGAALKDRPGHEPVPCHNDLLTANFLRSGDDLRIVDWEYAGMGDPWFDLGNLSINHELTPDEDAALVEAWLGRAPSRAAVARVTLMRVVSDLREAMWGVLQQAISTLDVDFVAYAAEHFDRLLDEASSPAFERRLRLAAGG